MRRPTQIGALAVGALGLVASAFAQESFLINPGARSIGLGGAFAAIADDATAAFANPSGLVQIIRPEVSVELRGTASSSSFGAAFERDAGVSGLGFFSLVYPVRRWSFAAYSHQLAGLDFTFNGATPFTSELTVRSYSTAVAFEVSEHVSVGAGLSSFRGVRGATPYAPRRSDSDWGVNAGLLWGPSEHWRVAGFFRQGPNFEGDAVHLPLDPRATSADQSLFEVPDVYGIGAAFRPGGGGLTVGLEIDRIGSWTESGAVGSTTSDGGMDFHVGAEYAVLRWKPVAAFRLGAWRAATGGRTRNVGPDSVHSSSGDTTHVALGAGVAFRKFQVDLGADFADNSIIASLSMVISF